ncbi:MAG: thermonuclease family protein [Solirubrobacterales bacterium]
MRRNFGSFLLLALVAIAIVRPWEQLRLGEEAPRSAMAQVLRVIDGDTIEVRVDGRTEDVRYIGIDTPETVKPGTPVQCFGPRAHRFNSHLVEGRRVRLVFGVERRDVYGRLLAYVHLGPRFVNAELVRRGFARTLEIAPNTRFAGRFKRLEMAAARAGKGLWGTC